MNLHPSLSLAEFREVMQELVMTHKPGSKPIMDAIHFARLHPDAMFLRVATEKVEAQKLFLREEFGVSAIQKVREFLSGSPREMVQRLLIVGGVLFILKSSGILPFGTNPTTPETDVDRLAKQMGIYVTEQQGFRDLSSRWDSLDDDVRDRIHTGIDNAAIEDAVRSRLNESLASPKVSAAVSEALSQRVESPEIDSAICRTLEGAINADEIRQIVATEVKAAIQSADIGNLIATSVREHIQDPTVQGALRSQLAESIRPEIAETVQAAIANSNLKQSIENQVQQGMDQMKLHAAKSERELNAHARTLLKLLDQTPEPSTTSTASTEASQTQNEPVSEATAESTNPVALAPVVQGN